MRGRWLLDGGVGEKQRSRQQRPRHDLRVGLPVLSSRAVGAGDAPRKHGLRTCCGKGWLRHGGGDARLRPSREARPDLPGEAVGPYVRCWPLRVLPGSKILAMASGEGIRRVTIMIVFPSLFLFLAGLGLHSIYQPLVALPHRYD